MSIYLSDCSNDCMHVNLYDPMLTDFLCIMIINSPKTHRRERDVACSHESIEREMIMKIVLCKNQRDHNTHTNTNKHLITLYRLLEYFK